MFVSDVVIFKMCNRTPSFPDKIQKLKFPKIMKVSSWQISFRRDSLLRTGVKFDEKLGVGGEFGSGEEIDYVLDLTNKGYKGRYFGENIIYHP